MPPCAICFSAWTCRRLGSGRINRKSSTIILPHRRSGTTICELAHRLAILAHPQARIYGGPLIASHVGADTAADLLATEMSLGNGNLHAGRRWHQHRSGGLAPRAHGCGVLSRRPSVRRRPDYLWHDRLRRRYRKSVPATMADGAFAPSATCRRAESAALD